MIPPAATDLRPGVAQEPAAASSTERPAAQSDRRGCAGPGGAESLRPDLPRATPAPHPPNVSNQPALPQELYNAIVKNDIKLVYKKIEEGADVNFVFGRAYRCPDGYTPLMVASHRGRLECAKALLRAGADPNYTNGAADLTLFWAIDGGVAMPPTPPAAAPGSAPAEKGGILAASSRHRSSHHPRHCSSLLPRTLRSPLHRR